MPGHFLTLVIFILTYAVIALGEIPWARIDRTGAALAGAVAMVISGALSESGAEHAIDFHTIALLLAMTVAASGLLAAFFINDVVCLALTPLVIDAAEIASVDPIPLLIGLATASNIGSAATITGNPQNMIVAGFAHLGYSSF